MLLKRAAASLALVLVTQGTCVDTVVQWSLTVDVDNDTCVKENQCVAYGVGLTHKHNLSLSYTTYKELSYKQH